MLAPVGNLAAEHIADEHPGCIQHAPRPGPKAAPDHRRLAFCNTTLVSKEQAPKTYQDLLDPRWRGKMAWNPGSIAGALGFVGATLMSMGDARGMDYLKALSAQRIVNIEASSRAILDQVIADEYPIGLMMFNQASASTISMA
jgi:ABC-type Fe3+ transport system substrate-binding protein